MDRHQIFTLAADMFDKALTLEKSLPLTPEFDNQRKLAFDLMQSALEMEKIIYTANAEDVNHLIVVLNA